MGHALGVNHALFSADLSGAVLLASWALVALWQRAGSNQTRRIIAGFAIAAVIILSVLWAFAFLSKSIANR